MCSSGWCTAFALCGALAAHNLPLLQCLVEWKDQKRIFIIAQRTTQERPKCSGDILQCIWKWAVNHHREGVGGLGEWKHVRTQLQWRSMFNCSLGGHWQSNHRWHCIICESITTNKICIDYRINIGPNHRSINLASCLGWWKFRLATYKTSKSTGLLVWLFVMSQNHQSDQIIDVVNKQVWLCAVGDHWYNRSHLHWTSARGDHVSGRMGGRSDPQQHSMPQWLFWQNPHILMLIVVVMPIS